MHRINWARHCSSSPRKWKISNSNFIEPLVYKLERWKIYKLLSLLSNLIYLDLGEVSGITDISTLSVTRLKYLKFLRCTSINTTSNTIQLIVSVPKALELEELDKRGIPLPSGNFTKLIDKFKTLRTLKVTFLHAANYNELIVALDPKRSGRPCTLQFLCLCDEHVLLLD